MPFNRHLTIGRSFQRSAGMPILREKRDITFHHYIGIRCIMDLVMSFDNDLVKGNIQGLILAVVESSPSHGYAIAREIERRSGGSLTFAEGTIYPALRALERGEFIVGVWDTTGPGPAKKVYHITADGQRELSSRKSTWKKFSSVIDLVLGAEGEPA